MNDMGKPVGTGSHGGQGVGSLRTRVNEKAIQSDTKLRALALGFAFSFAGGRCQQWRRLFCYMNNLF
jgi:hypothetical protein